MSHDRVICECSDGVATLTLNDAAKLNPFSRPMREQLHEVLAQLRSDKSVRAAILTGAGKAFCAGADLSTIAPPQGGSRGAAAAAEMDRAINPIIRAFRELPFPVISAVNGAAAGSGVGLALAADLVLAARSAYFYLPFLPRLGIIPDAGCTWFLPRLLGPGRTMGLALLGEKLSAEKAERWGLIWECVDDASLPHRARAVAERLASLPRHAVLEARRAFDAASRNTLADQLQYERDRQRELIDGPAFAEGVRAFMEKRPPIFG